MKTGRIEAEKAVETVTIPQAEYAGLRAELQELKAQNQWLLEQLRVIRQKKFGASSEKASEEVVEQLSLLFDEAEVYVAEESKEETPAVAVRSHTRRKGGDVRSIVPENIEVVETEHALPEEERVCPQCGETMQEIGKEVRETLELIPAKAVLHRDIYYTYACRDCQKNDITTPFVKTPKDPSVIPGGYASPESVAHIAVQKFVMGSPLYRQEQEWNRQGIMLSRQTMANWLIRCAEDWFGPVYDELHKQLLKLELLHADETELQVLHEPGKTAQSKSYMWLYRSSGDAEHPIVLYEYQPGRGQEHPKKFLAGFHGYLQTDGYAGYNAVEGVTHVGCWAHARRNFVEAQQSMPKGQRSPTADQGAAYCTKLFMLEREFADLSPEERKKQRLIQEKPVLDAMLAWANTRNAAPKSKLGIALTYLKNQWVYLNNYLLDGRIELSNNRAERSIKPFVISRKNFMFANTQLGAKSSAIIFSLIETAKENGLDPYRYLCFILRTAPVLRESDPDWAMKLIPQNDPDTCKA
jgi:transposase